MDSFYCHVCRQGPMPKNQYDQHCNGKTHKKKLSHNGPMQMDLPDDQRSSKFYSGNIEQQAVILLSDSDDDDQFSSYSAAPKEAAVPVEDFPALGGPAPPTTAMKNLNIGWGRGVGRGRAANSPASPAPPASAPQSTPAAPHSWASMAQAPTPSSTAPPPPDTALRPLSQSERSGNVRVIRQGPALPMPVQGNRPMAKVPKYLTAKRIYTEYKRHAKTASAAVQEIAASLQWILEEEEVVPDGRSLYAMRWKVDGVPCEKGQGSKKKAAKEEASRLVLQKYKRVIESQGELDMDSIEASIRPSGDHNRTQIRNMADDYKRLAMAKIDDIVRAARGSLEKPVRFAAFFVTITPDQPAIDSLLVALGTGRCVSKKTYDEVAGSWGYLLHDMQAPVVAKRAFQAFLYGQLSQIVAPTRVMGAQKYGETILEYNDETGRFRLKPGVRVHFYMSHAPAGDATAFDAVPPSDDDLTEEELQRDLAGLLEPEDADPRRGLGRLRVVLDPYRDETAILTEEAGEKFPGQKTAVSEDSTLQGSQRLRIMSLADKLMKWNHVGVQGSLLSIFLDPVFLYSIQIGSVFSHGHLARALVTRVPLDVFPAMPECYGSADDPFLARVTQVARLRNQIEGPVSVNWFQGCNGTEIVNCDEGKLSEECSRLSRVTMLMRLVGRWDDCLESGNVKHSGLTRRLRSLDRNVKDVNYGELKGLADDYQRAKTTVFSAIRNSNLGHWVPKDDLQSFCLRDYDE